MMDNLAVAIAFAAMGSVAGYYFAWFRFGYVLTRTKQCPVCKAIVEAIRGMKEL